MGNQNIIKRSFQEDNQKLIRKSFDININNQLIKIIRFKFNNQSHCVSHDQLRPKYIITRDWMQDSLKLWRIDSGYLNMSYIVKPSGLHCAFSHRAYNTSLGIISSSEKFQLITHVKNKMIRKKKCSADEFTSDPKVGIIYEEHSQLSFWNPETGDSMNTTLSGGDFRLITYSSINYELAISYKLIIRVINLQKWQIAKQVLQAKTDDDNFFNMILYSPNGQYILSLTDHILVVYNSKELKELWRFRISLIDCQYSNNSQFIIGTTKDKIFIYETANGNLLKSVRISSFSKCNELESIFDDKLHLFIMFQSKLK